MTSQLIAKVDTYSEEWRHECECRYVLSLKNLNDRRNYMSLVRKSRRKEAIKKLEEGVKNLFYYKRIEY